MARSMGPPRMSRGLNCTNARVVIPRRRVVGRDETNVPRVPDFIPEKRHKQDALRLSFVHNKETIKSHSAHPLAGADGTQAIKGLEAAFTAWVATQCERPLGQELSADEAIRHSQEVREAQTRELDAWCEFQVFTL